MQMSMSDGQFEGRTIDGGRREWRAEVAGFVVGKRTVTRLIMMDAVGQQCLLEVLGRGK